MVAAGEESVRHPRTLWVILLECVVRGALSHPSPFGNVLLRPAGRIRDPAIEPTRSWRQNLYMHCGRIPFSHAQSRVYGYVVNKSLENLTAEYQKSLPYPRHDKSGLAAALS